MTHHVQAYVCKFRLTIVRPLAMFIIRKDGVVVTA